MSQDKQRKPRNRSKNTSQPSSSPIPYQKNQPFWKGTIIQLLKGTIGVLENTVVKLETEQPKNTVKKRNFLELLLLRWDKFLQTFRLFLPSKVSNNVSDGVLTVILGILAIVIIGIITFLFTPKSTEVATLPPVQEVITPETTAKIEPKLEPEPTVELTPQPTPEIEEIKPEPEPEPTVELTPQLTPEIESKPEPEPTVELTPQPTPEREEIKPEPEPTPIVELTPEQNLIANIENQLVEIAVITVKNQEDEKININMINSIQTNLETSDLIITINDYWYKLEKPVQKKLAAKILQRSQELDFTHLQILDSQHKLIARSPVVGNEMIIFSKPSA
ncbi:MAG: hypothetical protein EAZ76_01845 [Nostocales cyanobacterium]|nr:MAG: hypothetical protein EAZ76_01845 [Nostocales cyanobacterium]